MAAQKGKDLLLKISDGAATPTFHTVAGLRAGMLGRVPQGQTLDWFDRRLPAHPAQTVLTLEGSLLHVGCKQRC